MVVVQIEQLENTNCLMKLEVSVGKRLAQAQGGEREVVA